jgi:hypothetical protein
MKLGNILLTLSIPIILMGPSCKSELKNVQYVGEQINSYPGPCFMQQGNERVFEIFQENESYRYLINSKKIEINPFCKYNIIFNPLTGNIKSAEKVSN